MLRLTKKEQEHVRDIIKRGKNAREITRAHVLNLRHKGYVPIEIADILEITSRTVINVTNNHKEGGIKKALEDDPRPGQPPKFDARIKANIVAIVCSDPPEGFDRWTLELLQETVIKENVIDAISKEKIRIILHEHDIKPWQYKMWCIPRLDDEYIERMEGILDIYEKKYDPRRPVVCVDEKPVALQGDKRDPIRGSVGSVKKIDYEYSRHGSANVFCAVEPKAGLYINQVTKRKTKKDFAKFIGLVDRKYHDVNKVTMVMDNYSTHFEKALIEFYGKDAGHKIWKKFDVHYTPKHGSWLNQAEIAIGMYDRQCLGHSRIPEIDVLRKKTKAWNRIVNHKSVKINWQFTKNDAREKFSYD